MSTTHEHSHDVDEPCVHCGGAMHIERAYKIRDRFAQSLIVGLASSLGLQAYWKGRASGTVYVGGTNRAALDQFQQRLHELMPQLDAVLIPVAVRFVEQHTGFRLNADK